MEKLKKEIINIPYYDSEGNGMARSTFTDLVFDLIDEHQDKKQQTIDKAIEVCEERLLNDKVFIKNAKIEPDDKLLLKYHARINLCETLLSILKEGTIDKIDIMREEEV